ncbi:NADPH-dependent oxidoreductase [Synechococcus sp. RSCCF101]|uniref:NADPH-dependent FMN reductase n=1 Tax=Synechococcus sp. RSCCF101 TaxID=2511069 RepID=UPI001246F619|nr:NAD(P)H-dependent oxidoreductase [Synechococcus sp. RSCCF101]QEY32749.1 NADPH-dependent oxidoreductase [Synechococcus sp. RSCCF101]
MTANATPDVLVISASNGENLKLGERFVAAGRELGRQTDLLDLTSLPLPLYNPRAHAADGVPDAARALSSQLQAAPRWLICAPEYNGSIPPVLSSAIAWLSVQGDDFRTLFNGRPIGMASHSGGGGMELLTVLRIQLAHLGAQVVGRQVQANAAKPAKPESIRDLMVRLLQMEPLQLS